MPSSVLDGAKELLTDTVAALNAASISDYMVVGGWCPYLRNTSGLHHPGTLDVDILFRDANTPGALAAAINALRLKGFVASAKHSFQLLLEKDVSGERLIYNVDLLHPYMTNTSKGMFVDHLELDVPLDDEERRLKTACSIVMPNSMVLFEKNLFSAFTMGAVTFNLVDFTGMFITKMDSCQKQKRERDAFDMYLGLKSGLIDFEALKQLRAKDYRVGRSLETLLTYLEEKPTEFDGNVAMFVNPSESPSAALRQALIQ